MKKNTYNWMWKWHYIGGVVSFPVVFILAITGIVYLFKDQYEAPRQAHFKTVEVQGERLSFQEQWALAKNAWDKPINEIVIPESDHQATEFVSGRFSNKSSLFLNPYTGEVTKVMAENETDMHKVRKLHGELLTGSVGTKLVELVGSWLIVLIISGLFLFFPRKRKDWIKLVRIRFRGSKQLRYRDIHMVGGFWFSVILLIILAGGMPWTDVWGDGFKWVQKQTHTGYPATWQGRGLFSIQKESNFSLDEVVTFAKSQNLPGELKISLPGSEKGVYGIHNTYHPNQSKQVAIHIDQYSGEEIYRQHWSEVGVLMRARMWAMAFHQGQFGLWNWLLVLITAFGLLILSSSAIIAYTLRKKPRNYLGSQRPGHWVFYVFLALMAILLPLFGLSVLAILLYEGIMRLYHKTSSKETVIPS